MQPVLIVIAGPNGAGKTTVTARLRQDHWSEGIEYLNPDEVARDRFGDWNSPAAILQAAQWTEKRREELLAAGSGLAFETVLSAEDKLRFVQRARAKGYFVRAFFVSTGDPAINAALGGGGKPRPAAAREVRRSAFVLTPPRSQGEACPLL
jgi:predicted ABC-type ATPase